MRAALKRVKYQILAGLLLSASAGLLAYGLEAREITAEAERMAAEQIGEIEERFALAYAELDSTATLISQADPAVSVLKDYVNGLALSKSKTVPWLWAQVVAENDVATFEMAIRSQDTLKLFAVKRVPGQSPILAPVVFITGVESAKLIGTDLLVQPELLRLATDAGNAAMRNIHEPVVTLSLEGLPPDILFMTRYVSPLSKQRTGTNWPSLILRGLTSANLARAAQLKEGQLLRLIDASFNPPRPLLQVGDVRTDTEWLPSSQFSIGDQIYDVSLSKPGRQALPIWWMFIAVGGVLLTGLYAALRSGFIVGARATQLGSILTTTEQRLADTERREVAFFENSGTGNCETDFTTGQLVRVNDSLCNMLGYRREELVGKQFSDITHPDDISLSRSVLVDHNNNPKTHLEFEKRYLRKDGTAMWSLVNARLYFDSAGRPKSYMTVIVNIDDRKRDEATKALLTRELAHRVRNTVQLTSSLARQTAATARTVDDYDTKFHRRLAALSAAQDILFDRHWMSAPLSRIAQAIFKPFLPEDQRQGAFSVDLPDVELPTQQAQTIAIALHELASNSAKYGALSNGGSVSVVGTILAEKEGNVRTLHLKWDERSGLPVRKPRRAGFGTRMLLSAMPEQFGGSAKAIWRSNGLQYEAWLNLPASDPVLVNLPVLPPAR